MAAVCGQWGPQESSTTLNDEASSITIGRWCHSAWVENFRTTMLFIWKLRLSRGCILPRRKFFVSSHLRRLALLFTCSSVFGSASPKSTTAHPPASVRDEVIVLQPAPDLSPPIEYCVRGNFSLEMVHLQEATWSMRNALSVVAKDMRPVMATLTSVFESVSVGLSSFIDKPFEPLGQAGVDYCYKRHLPLTNWNSPGAANQFFSRLDVLDNGSGRDAFEFQLDTIHYEALTTLWSSPDPHKLRLLVMVTDYLWHEEGDADFLPPHTGEAEVFCDTHDYVSKTMVREAVTRANASVLFLVPDPYNIVHFFKTFAGSLHPAATALTLDVNLTDFVDRFVDGVGQICKGHLFPLPTDFQDDGDRQEEEI